jgi:hypothetical protein
MRAAAAAVWPFPDIEAWCNASVGRAHDSPVMDVIYLIKLNNLM